MDWRSQFEMFMPHGMCLLWLPGLMSLHIISDGLIAVAYFSIPFSIMRFLRGRDDLDGLHIGLAWLFAAFIALCGLTHLVSIVVLWIPIYIIEGWLKALTAVVSVATAVWLFILVPQAIKMPTIKAMQREIAAHRETMAALDAARIALAAKVDYTQGELRLSEQYRSQSLALLNTVAEIFPGMIYAKDRDGRMVLANNATLAFIGKPWAEIEGKTDREFLADARQGAQVMANDRRVIESGKAQEIEEIVDHPVDGRRVVLSTKVPIDTANDADGGIVGMSIDITERKRLEKELLHMSRRTAMGDMAAAIAHEISQPFAAIGLYLGGSQALLEADGYSGPAIEALALAKDQCQRAGEIIRRVRSFVAGDGEMRERASLSSIVAEACGLALMGARDEGLTVLIHHAHDETWVMVDKIQIGQVIVNLVRNALDAMGDAPRSVLQVFTGHDDAGMAFVSVDDNGPGISDSVTDRLFDSFVSTKGVKGMGVGLSICRTIVEAHGGRIWAEPKAGPGTTFRFTLPSLGPGHDG